MVKDVDISAYLTDIIDRLFFRTIAEADRYLKLHYETVFQIYDHNSVMARTKRPSSPTHYHPGLDRGVDAVSVELLTKYHENRIYDIAKMPFTEYIMIPRSRFKLFSNECRRLAEQMDKEKEIRDKRQHDEILAIMNGKNNPKQQGQ